MVPIPIAAADGSRAARRSPLIVTTMPGGEIEHFGESAPLKRAGQPAEMASIYVLLASNESSYVTGMIYGATGGEITT
jgi:NAD(P)-dependent dehydrogenase (short-subunit alcohol dehydrogenase family)